VSQLLLASKELEDLKTLLATTPLGGASDTDALLTRFERRVLDAGRTFVVEGDAGGSLAVIAEGSVRATRRVSDDRDLAVFMLKRGDVFGFLPLLDGGRCPLSLAAETHAIVYVLERRLFQDFLKQNPAFCTHLLEYLAGRFRECIDQLGLLGKPGAVPRVAAALAGQLPAGAKKGVVIGWPMRQTDLARALGIAPENLSRAISRLQQMGIIHRAAGRQLRIDDPVRLRAAAERSLPEIDDRQ
jgi:CRP-like cAMP-binding protein